MRNELVGVERLLRIMSGNTVHACLTDCRGTHMEQAKAWRWFDQFQSGFKSGLYGRCTIEEEGW